MKKEDLFDGFGMLDDELLQRSERRKKNKIIKFGSLAACLAAVIAAGVLFMERDKVFIFEIIPKSNIAIKNNETVPQNEIAPENHEAISTTQSNIQEESENYVDVKMLLASNEGQVVKHALAFKYMEIAEYSALYYKVSSIDSKILKESIGNEVEGTENWHKLSGHNDMQYLIFNDNNEYSLWEFHAFQEESYVYRDVLQIIYHINSAEDITEIIVNPATMDNSNEGKAIQKEIGTSIITDKKEIETLYYVLSGLTCYGSNHWEMIGLGDDSPLAMHNYVRAGRYLTLVTSDGIEINSLKYTGISGMFYEYGGIAYNALTIEEKSAVEEILNIE